MFRESYLKFLSLFLLSATFYLLFMACGGGGGGSSVLPPSPTGKKYLGGLLRGDVVEVTVDDSSSSLHWENDTTGDTGEASFTENEGVMEAPCLGFSSDMYLFDLANFLVGVLPSGNGAAMIAIPAYNWGSYSNLRSALLGKSFIGIGIDKLTGYLEYAEIDNAGNVDLYKAWYDSALSSPYTNLTTSCEGELDLNSTSGCHSSYPNFFPLTMSSNMSFDGEKLVINQDGDETTFIAGYLNDGRLFLIVDNGPNQGLDVFVEYKPGYSFQPDTSAIYKFILGETDGNNFSFDPSNFTDYFVVYPDPQTVTIKLTSDGSSFDSGTLLDNSANWKGTYRVTMTTSGEVIYFLPVNGELQFILKPEAPGGRSSIGAVFKTPASPM